MPPLCLSQIRCLWREPQVWNKGEKSQSAHDLLGPIGSIHSDGDAGRRRAFIQFASDSYFSSGEDGYLRVLVACAMMDQEAAPGEIVYGMDPKHLVKRLRERLKSETTGVRVGGGAAITGPVLRHLALALDPTRNVESLLDPADRCVCFARTV